MTSTVHPGQCFLSIKDEKILEYLRHEQDNSIEENYLTLLSAYIDVNIGAITRIEAAKKNIEQFCFDDRFEEIDGLLHGLTDKDKQSLFFIRTYASLHALDPAAIVNVVGRSSYSQFLRERFLYPLIYFAIHSPSDEHLDSLVAYLVDATQHDIQSAIIKFLLKDDRFSSTPLSFKLYVALSSHPFDAKEIFLNHLEQKVARRVALSQPELNAFQKLFAKHNCARSEAIHRSVANISTAATFDSIVPTVLQQIGASDATKMLWKSLISMEPYSRPDLAVDKPGSGLNYV